jgi:diadenosine tetraphosphate (Ap4A) HIT family hydrolase
MIAVWYRLYVTLHVTKADVRLSITNVYINLPHQGQLIKGTVHLHLVPRSRMSGAILPFPQYAFMAWCSVKAQEKLYRLRELNYMF